MSYTVFDMPATRRTPAALSKGDRTRARIVETAIKLLSKHGYAGTSFQMIAESIGLTQSAVMHHFKDKSQLIEAVVNTAVGRNVAIVETLNRPDDDAARRLIHFCQGNLLWVRHRREDAHILALLYYLAGHDKVFARNLRRIVQRGWEVILGHLLAGRREGIFHFTRPPEEVARLLQDNIIGAMLFAIAHPDIVKPKDFKEKWEEAVALHAGWKR